ncbi:MAG: carboxylating nicotinate-nucleotide diphosphorylase [Bacteroidales bacterium]|nr:carboxylating nicotinate-nucleotide diphosphorylase [Bacteroidales bacterium]
MDWNSYVEKFIQLALDEDIGDGDHTSLATIPQNKKGKAQLLAKDNGIIAGIELAEIVFNKLDPNFVLHKNMHDGDTIGHGDIVFTVEGSVIQLLQAERLVLNIMQRMSGVATQTRKYVDKLDGLKTKVLDTRKTTPGMRLLDKQAVKLGGGVNHRIGLFDMILIKDNHIDFAGGIENALNNTREYLKSKNKQLKIEIETRSLDDLAKVIEIGGIDRVMIDNFSIEDTKKAVEMVNGKFEIESSGGITIENLRDYAECGVDYISVGALTHQIKSLDLSLKALDY